jgi:hypothetical protein
MTWRARSSKRPIWEPVRPPDDELEDDSDEPEEPSNKPLMAPMMNRTMKMPQTYSMADYSRV